MSTRRNFLTTAIAAMGGVSLLSTARSRAENVTESTGQGVAGPVRPMPSDMTIRQAIDRIVADIPGAPFKTTVDTVKSGDPDQPLKGIVTTMFATDAVIEQTIQLGANFIIAH